MYTYFMKTGVKSVVPEQKKHLNVVQYLELDLSYQH